MQTPTVTAGVGRKVRASKIEKAPLIEDHALIGDMRTAALVTKDGSIDWLCLPAFDSDACFASLLGSEKNGRWRIAPTVPVIEVNRRYRPDTLILETDFVTEGGVLRLIDFMPPRKGREPSHVCRILRCIEGRVPVRSDVIARLSFGRAIPRTLTIDGATRMFAGPDALHLRGGGNGNGRAPELVEEIVLTKGQEVAYSLTHGWSWEDDVPEAIDARAAEKATEAFWKEWTSKLRVAPRYRDLVIRSLITLKACIYEPTSAIVAAPTTSLPETPGGVRNWDYRFCWLRDGALSMRAMMNAGLPEEARGFFHWMLRAIAGDPAQVQIMYGLRGERRLSEAELDWLDGYEGARPVRVGNAAYDQAQLDVFGEVGLTLYEGITQFKNVRPEALRALVNIARFVASAWKKPDRGIWEMRGPERHFTASKVSAWGAIDRAIKCVEERGLSEPIDDLRAARQEIFDEVMREGWNEELQTFTQYYGGTDVDASLLFIPIAGFLPPDHPRVAGTIRALERELMQDGLLLRFKPVAETDGLVGDEGVFLACSFWLAGTYQMMGRTEDATRTFERAAATANDLGLLAEEYEPKTGRQLGNFPQAFSHFALVNAAFALGEGESMVAGGAPVTPAQ